MGFAPSDNKIFYLATQYLLATRDKGMTWQAVSPDLTAGDAPPAEAGGRGGRGGGPAISALAFAPGDAKQIWAGTSNGRLHLSRDGGARWTNVASGEMSQGGAVTTVEASPTDPARAFALVGAAGGGGGRGATVTAPAARIYRTDDYGQSWKLMNHGLPNSAAHAVREDPVNRNLVFAALDSGVFVSFNGGGDWCNRSS